MERTQILSDETRKNLQQALAGFEGCFGDMSTEELVKVKEKGLLRKRREANLLEVYLLFAKQPYKRSVLSELLQIGLTVKQLGPDLFMLRQFFPGDYDELLRILQESDADRSEPLIAYYVQA